MDNHKNREIDTKCEFCDSEDTTEHLLECYILQRLTQEEMKAINLETVDNMQELIIIMVIFKCYFSGELIDLSHKKTKQQRCEHRIRKNKQIKSTVHDAN